MTDYDRERQARQKALRQISNCRDRLVRTVRGAMSDLEHYGVRSGLGLAEAGIALEDVAEAINALDENLLRYQTAAIERFEMRFGHRRGEADA